ncbi:MAG: hypothetical protein QGI55_18130 [Pseudomonadales bacterium]|nr:hypothetical protein [Pseudomonadales bacterium]
MSQPAISAPELILSLVDSAADPALSAGYFVTAGELFGIDSPTTRVALTRLTKKGVLQQLERGVYGLGASGSTLHRTVVQWQRVEAALMQWSGGWLMVLVAHLPRSRTDVRRRDRALHLDGYAKTSTGVWVRPANLRGGLPAAHRRLTDYGLDDGAIVTEVTSVWPLRAFETETLWDTAALERGYRQHIAELAHSTGTLTGLGEDDAARETLLLGRRVTRAILTDPLLPAEMVDADLRSRMIRDMRDYDRLGKRCWRTFYRLHG